MSNTLDTTLEESYYFEVGKTHKISFEFINRSSYKLTKIKFNDTRIKMTTVVRSLKPHQRRRCVINIHSPLTDIECHPISFNTTCIVSHPKEV